MTDSIVHTHSTRIIIITEDEFELQLCSFLLLWLTFVALPN